jgi:hypothetical protein
LIITNTKNPIPILGKVICLTLWKAFIENPIEQKTIAMVKILQIYRKLLLPKYAKR